MKHAIPEMRKNGGGSIISTASIAGLFGGFGPYAYSAAKGAVVNLTRSVALEVAKHRIRVNCICPGGINTPIFNVLTTDANQMEQLLAALCPLKRSGHPEDIANMALFLASDEAQWITGRAMVVDGGVTAGSTMMESPNWGGSPYGGNAYVGPSFTVGKS
jgi:NAD(P)-dependent dehydrogenase (short-subunit alcohol dehydrogenase family)